MSAPHLGGLGNVKELPQRPDGVEKGRSLMADKPPLRAEFRLVRADCPRPIVTDRQLEALSALLSSTRERGA